MTLFDFDDYQAYLKFDVEAHSGERGYLTKMATAAACQKSYLSQVIRGTVHFTPEHAIRIAEFWNLGETESEFFLQLVHLGRTSYGPLKNKIKSRLRVLKTERENLAKRLAENTIQDSAAQLAYYSSWIPSALHVITDIEKFRTVDAIAKRLSLPPAVVRSQLESLEQINLVKRQGVNWTRSIGNLHVARGDALNVMNHQNWRSRAVLDVQNPSNDSLHYSAVQSLSLSDFEKIKSLILQFIDQQRKIVGPSESEEIACFTCDWFKI